MLGQRLEQQRQRHRPDRLLAHERIGRDVDLMPIMKVL